jgi:hypothetical protein
VTPVVPRAPDGEHALIPDDLADDLEADALETGGHGNGMAVGVPHVADGQAGHQGVCVRPVDAGVAGHGCVAVARRSLVGAHGRACGAIRVGFGTDAQVAGFGGTQGVVHAVPPGRIERHAVGRVGRQQRRLRAVEQPRDVVGARGIAAQEAMLAEDVEVARPDVGHIGDGRHVVGINQTTPEGIEPVVAGEVVEQRPEGLVGGFEPFQQRGELFLLGARHRR